MSFENPSANMNMPIPGVSLTSGPTWASDLNASLTILDNHDHSPGNGVKVTPAGIDISTDLAFGSNNALAMRSSRYTPQSSPLALAADLDCTYVSGVDLWYNDGLGNQIQITAGGGVAGTPGSISNLTPPASASYVAGSSTFVWQSDVNTPANMDFASAILRNLSVSSFGLTLGPPLAMGADYSITLPLLPVSQSFITIDNTGSMGASVSTSGGITGSMIAAATITGSNVAPATIAASNLTPTAVNESIQVTTLTTGTGTFTVPASITKILITGIGAGGGGANGGASAGGINSSGGGGGGGAGSVGTVIMDVTPGQVFNYTIGVGGLNNANGGATTFGDLKWSGGGAGQLGTPSGLHGDAGIGGIFAQDGGAGGDGVTGGGPGNNGGPGMGQNGGVYGNGGAGGGGSGGGGGGGGAGSPYGAGGNGGPGQNGGNNAYFAHPTPGGTGAGGGAGGGARSNAGNAGDFGAAGGDGRIDIYY